MPAVPKKLWEIKEKKGKERRVEDRKGTEKKRKRKGQIGRRREIDGE